MAVEIIETSLPDVKIVRPLKRGDERGWFAECFNARDYAAAGLPQTFVQDNQSFSQRGVLRGLHFQVDEPQGKLVRVLSGHIWDVAVDLRPGSTNMGKWVGVHLRGEDLQLLWIPEGFAHGFVVLSENASVMYKTTGYYSPQGERCVRWNDPTLDIRWPLDEIGEPVLSPKDAAGSLLGAVELHDASRDRV